MDIEKKFFGIFKKLIENGLAKPIEGYSANEANIYDRIQQSWDEEIAFYKELLGQKPYHILELGCGTGRLLIPLLTMGYKVTGLDSSKDMLAICEHKVNKSYPNAKSRLQLMNADMSNFNISDKFDRIISAINSFQHLITVEQRKRFLRSGAMHLRKGGLFIIDMKYLRVFNPGISKLSCDLVDNGKDKQVLYISQSKFDAITKEEIFNVLQVPLNSGKEVVPTVATYKAYLPTLQEMELLIEQSGLQVRDRYSSFDKKPLSADSNNVIWVLQKANAKANRKY